MIAFLDVHYFDTYARAAAVVVNEWEQSEARSIHAIEMPVPDDYQAGQFYKRELSPLLAVLEQIAEPLDIVLVDGYCQLDAIGAPGLGVYLHDALGGRLPVVGVAKNRFRDSQHAIEVVRGSSKNPLFVTAVGIDETLAADRIASMAGDHRIPTLLKQVDRVARHGNT